MRQFTGTSLRSPKGCGNPVITSKGKPLDCFALLMKQLAIPLGEQKTLTKWLVIAMTCLWIALLPPRASWLKAARNDDG